jgi:hypothetical protein
MKCPLCEKYELVSQSQEDSFGNEPDVFCPEIIKMPDGKIFNHYREFREADQIRMFALPYRIITEHGMSKVGLRSQYKSGTYYFKTVLKLPVIHPDRQDRLLQRIKLLLLLS